MLNGRDMLPPFIIEQLREREEQARREAEREQPRLELPVPPVVRRPAADDEEGRGVTEIQNLVTRDRGRAAVLILSILGLAALGYLWIGDAPRGAGSETPNESIREAPAAPIEVARAPRFSVDEEAEAPAAPPAPPPPDGEEHAAMADPGFCPEPGESLPPYARPSLAQLLNDRTDELVARARLVSGEQGSEALRRGLALLNDPSRGADAIATLANAPDRRDGAFDFAAAAAVAAGARALAEHRDRDVTEIVDAALRASGRDPIVHVLAAHVAFYRHALVEAREALEAAFALDPEEPTVALPLGRLASNTPDEALALRALRVYLDAYPDDVEMARLAARVELRRDLARDYQSLSRGGLTLRYAPSVSPDDARATLDLADGVLSEAARLLGVSPREELSIVVYESRSELRAVTCIPGWAGGVYDGSLRLSGPTVHDPTERTRVVRHEGLHAALSDAVGPAPYWFNEGLAQRFAHEHSRAHEASWARMRASGLVIPFPSLDGSFLDIDDSDDAQLAYHQSLAMVDLLAARRGERVFADAVGYLKEGGDRAELFSFLAGPRPVTSADLVEFLRAE